MRKIVSHSRIILVAFFALAMGFLVLAPPVQAADTATPENIKEICDANPDASICSDLEDPDGLNSTFQNLISVMLFAAGIIAVIMIIVSGIRMTTSRGVPEAVTKARHTLMYSIIGLVVAVMAFAIVNFVLGSL